MTTNLQRETTTVSACCGAEMYKSKVGSNNYIVCLSCQKLCEPTHPPTETVSDCCNAPVEWRYEGTEGDMTRYYRCSKCKRDFIPPTDTDKKVWGSICCNVGVMCRGVGKDHYHICNKCGERCEVRYDETPTEPTVEKREFDVADYVHQGDYDDDLPIYGIEEANKAVKTLVSLSVQEAKAERDREWMMGMYQMFGNSKGGRVGMAILASLKQEEEK